MRLVWMLPARMLRPNRWVGKLCLSGFSWVAVDLKLAGSCMAAARQVAGSTPGGTAPPALLEEAAAAASKLEQQLGGSAEDAAPGDFARHLQQLLPAAERTAAVVQQNQALLQQAHAAQLDLACAAAGRSCAHLRCPDVQAGGGAFAGQGVGSKRCR